MNIEKELIKYNDRNPNNKMSLVGLSREVGMSHPVIINWNKNTPIQLKTAKKLCKVLGCTFEELFG